MRRAIGPIITTGVAIVVAGVVVANPIVAPRADVQIPAVKLSGSSDATGSMLDQAFLDAIAPGPADSTNPFSVLKQLITSLAADATTLGKNAIVNAFVAGVTAVSEPELTASSLPYVSDGVSGAVSAAVAPPPDFAGIASLAQAAGLDPAAIVNGSVDIVSAIDPTHVTNSIGTAVDQLASSIVNDAGYVGRELIAAAYAAGAVVASEPAMIAQTLQSLVKGDIKGALESAVAAATAPFGPTGIVIDAFVTVVESHLSQITTGVPTIDVPAPLVGNPLTSVASPPAATLSGVADRGLRSAITVTVAPVTETATSEAPAAKPADPTDLSSVARGLAGVAGLVDTADAATGDVSAAPEQASTPRAVARGAKPARDSVRASAGRGVRGSAPSN